MPHISFCAVVTPTPNRIWISYLTPSLIFLHEPNKELRINQIHTSTPSRSPTTNSYAYSYVATKRMNHWNKLPRILSWCCTTIFNMLEFVRAGPWPSYCLLEVTYNSSHLDIWTRSMFCLAYRRKSLTILKEWYWVTKHNNPLALPVFYYYSWTTSS